MENYGTKLDNLLHQSLIKSLMKIKFNLDGDLPQKQLELYNMIIAIRYIFHEHNKYYLQVFLDNFFVSYKN